MVHRLNGESEQGKERRDWHEQCFLHRRCYCRSVFYSRLFGAEVAAERAADVPAIGFQICLILDGNPARGSVSYKSKTTRRESRLLLEAGLR